MPKVRKPYTWRGKTARVKGDGAISIRRIKLARARKIAKDMIAFSGPNNGVVSIICCENRSRLDLPIRWIPAVIEHLRAIRETSALLEKAAPCPSA